MADAVDLLEHWLAHPTEQAILEAVHIKGATGRPMGPRAVQGASLPQTKEEAIAELSAAGAMAGMGPMKPIPAHLRKLVEAAEEVKAKMAAGRTRRDEN
jgi:hypothetical protein